MIDKLVLLSFIPKHDISLLKSNFDFVLKWNHEMMSLAYTWGGLWKVAQLLIADCIVAGIILLFG